MSTKESSVIKRVLKLDIPRESATAQAVILTNANTPIPLIYLIEDLGDAGRDGKFAANAIPGGRCEVFFSVTIDGVTHKGFIERDLLTRGFKSLELNGEIITEKRGLQSLLRWYPLGSTLLLTGMQDGKEESYFITTERDETPAEGVIREARMETGLECEIVESDVAYFPQRHRNDADESCYMEPSQYGEVLHEINSDYDKERHPGKNLKHHVFVFLLKSLGKTKEEIVEIDEVSMISETRLSVFIRKIFCEPLASRDNPKGFYFKHGLRVMNTLWATRFNHIPFM
ncbi:MAG: hypothetical protein HYW88_03180, partial [Candidatus Sungbacteria bacterium]|nr:hypothetical protein [Candidatus Sungbacteria bacterium]